MPNNHELILSLYRDGLVKRFKDKDFVVFLCGPSIDGDDIGGKLRKTIKEYLENENFEVFLGEDDGLEKLQLMFGIDAQQNELQFINSHCNAVVIIAASVGSFCELGLFSFLKHDWPDWEKIDLILVIDEKYKGKGSYLNLGPATSVESWGKVLYEDFNTYCGTSIIERLNNRRATYSFSKRGRPRKED